MVIVGVAVVVAAVVSTVSAQTASALCTPQATKYFTVTAMQTMTKFLMRPDDPHDLAQRLENELIFRHLPQTGQELLLPRHGYLPPPAHGYLPPPGHGYLPPPGHGYLPPPAHGYLPPPGLGYRPTRTSTPITITPTPVSTVRPTVENIIVPPCRCNACFILVQDNPCQCAPDFGCGGLNEVLLRRVQLEQSGR